MPAPAITDMRAFNRFYTRQIGLLDEHLTGSPFTLAEARVLHELATGGERTAAGIGRLLGMDKAQLSRILARFQARGEVAADVSPLNARHKLLSLTDAGRAAFADLDAGAQAQIGRVLEGLDPEAIRRLTDAMLDIMTILDSAAPAAGDDVLLRAPRSGDLGWVIHRQTTLYAQEYGWDWQYEGLAAAILGAFVSTFDSAREQAWIAEHRGRIAGSIFLMRGDDPDTAKLRLLYVEPTARGAGIGRRLVAACIERARAIGYRTLTLWTNDVLVSARRIYEAAGFTLTAEEAHHSFGHDLIGQIWTLDLMKEPDA